MMSASAKFRFQAHRGVSTDYPENTLVAFKGAVDQGYDLIELDPKFTADNQCVILHDATINRTGRYADGSRIPGSMAISSITLDDVRKFDFGVWASPEYAGENIPTLDEALCFSQEHGIPLKFDNVMESFTDDQRKIFFDAVKKFGFRSNIGFTCKSLGYLSKVIEVFPDAEIHYDGPFDEDTLKTIVQCLKNNRLTIWVGFSSATKEICALAKQYGELGLWILTSEEQLHSAIHTYHADVIETDGSIKPSMINHAEPHQ
ncbi:MAG TPA: glycerophosphodiester phosphodiesterase family protein [Armatimonadota bacterium]|nr:glycerophosphodiester phosphodiesterase family protein [Armatimonadota bacterium]